LTMPPHTPMHMLPKTDKRAQVAELLAPLHGPDVLLEPVTWMLAKDGQQLVRACRKPKPGDPNGGCIFFPVDDVLDAFDILGEGAELLYEMHFMKHRMA